MPSVEGAPISRPLDPDGLASRIAPFAGGLLVAFAFVNLRHAAACPIGS